MISPVPRPPANDSKLGGSPGMISPVPRPPANDNKLGGSPGMISLLLLRAMFSWEEYSHGKHRLLDMCRYMFVCYQTFPGAILNISWEISGTIPGICCLVHCPIFLHASSAVDISQVYTFP